MGLPCRWGSPKSQGSSVRRARLDKGPRLGVVRYLPASLLLEQLDSLAKTLTPCRADSLASTCSAPSICGVISEMKASFLFVLPGYSSLLIYSFCKHMLDDEPGTGPVRHWGNQGVFSWSGGSGCWWWQERIVARMMQWHQYKDEGQGAFSRPHSAGWTGLWERWGQGDFRDSHQAWRRDRSQINGTEKGIVSERGNSICKG